MRITTCTLTLGSRQAQASVSTRSPQAENRVDYSGDAELLPERFERLDNATLRLLFRQAAQRLGAQLDIKEDGAFESFAE